MTGTPRRRHVQVKSLASVDAFRSHCEDVGAEIPVDDVIATGDGAPLAQPLDTEAGRLGNRLAILPMEGWDGTNDGRPTDLVRRRWSRFGSSGADLIWGGEAFAVQHAGRANPHQLVIEERTADDIAGLRRTLRDGRAEAGLDGEPVIGLQLTHSGRFSRPDDEPRPRIAYRHPVLDARVGAGGDDVLSDDDLDALVGRFVAAAVIAEQAGFDFVDVKHCHGYLGHELLSGVDRPGPYGGTFEGRTRFLRSVVEGIGSAAPRLVIGVRLSVFDLVAFRPGPDGVGEPDIAGDGADAPFAFGGSADGLRPDLRETHRFCDLLGDLGVGLLCVTAGSPYYNPHIQRPAYFPPSDGYRPPEDPLVGVARILTATAEIKARHPGLVVVASGLSYVQDWFGHVAQAVVGQGVADVVGLGRMVLSYPTLPADLLAGRPFERRLVCRTFSDCTTAPRNGLVSGCYPLDPLYKDSDARVQLAAAKRRTRD